MLDPLAIATQGIGFSPLLVATQGLVDAGVDVALPGPRGAGRSAERLDLRALRIRRADDDLLLAAAAFLAWHGR